MFCSWTSSVRVSLCPFLPSPGRTVCGILSGDAEVPSSRRSVSCVGGGFWMLILHIGYVFSEWYRCLNFAPIYLTCRSFVFFLSEDLQDSRLFVPLWAVSHLLLWPSSSWSTQLRNPTCFSAMNQMTRRAWASVRSKNHLICADLLRIRGWPGIAGFAVGVCIVLKARHTWHGAFRFGAFSFRILQGMRDFHGIYRRRLINLAKICQVGSIKVDRGAGKTLKWCCKPSFDYILLLLWKEGSMWF